MVVLTDIDVAFTSTVYTRTRTLHMTNQLDTQNDTNPIMAFSKRKRSCAQVVPELMTSHILHVHNLFVCSIDQLHRRRKLFDFGGAVCVRL